MNQGSASLPPSSRLDPSPEILPVDPHPPAPMAHAWWQLWPGVLAIAVLLALAGYGARQAIALNGGRLTYPIDDAYGHLAIAKNLAHHGIWGFSYLDGFSSGGSSLIWPVVIAACFAAFGTHDYIPFILDLIVASGLLLYAAGMLRRYPVSGWLSFLILAVLTYLTPLAAVAATGMEHCLHALAALAFVDVAVRVLTGELPLDGRATRVGLPLLAVLLVITRYEGLFIIAVVGFLFLCRGWWRPALIFGAASAVIPSLFGLYSVYKGWYFVPNSLLLKGNTGHIQVSVAGLIQYFSKGYGQLIANPHILFLLLAVVAGLVGSLRRHRTFWSTPVLLLAVTLGVSAIHLQYAAFGWFYRYEAYIVVLGLMSLGVCLVDAGGPRATAPVTIDAAGGPLPALWWRQRLIWLLPYAASLLLAAVCFGVPLIRRADEATRILPMACHNIYEQQFQMGMFLRRHYQSQGVAANDIGAIDYLADVRLFDIFGLADVDVLRAKRADAYGYRQVEQAFKKHDIRVVMIYDTWRGDYGLQLPEWVPVGQWVIPNNVVCGWHIVSFYAPNAALVPELTHALQDFGPRLPKDVGQFGPYRGDRASQTEIGTYGAETDAEGIFHWAAHGAKFFQYPLDGRPALKAEETQAASLHLTVAPTFRCAAVDVYVNGQLIGTHDFKADSAGAWTAWDMPARVQNDLNTVSLIGHGDAGHLPGDGRKLLFAMRVPAWTLPPTAVPTPSS